MFPDWPDRKPKNRYHNGSSFIRNKDVTDRSRDTCIDGSFYPLNRGRDNEEKRFKRIHESKGFDKNCGMWLSLKDGSLLL